MARCINEMRIVNKKKGQHDTFPCGRCYACQSNRINAWGFRLDQELLYSWSAYFITLTYNDENIISTNNGLYTLFKPEIQGFLKRLRQNELRIKGSNRKISYYAVGEYGEFTARPHYHMIIFNAHQDMIIKSWVNSKSEPLGNVHFDEVNFKSIRYVTGYFAKGKQVPLFDEDDRQKEFSLMSKNIGIKFLTEDMQKWYKKNPAERYYLPLMDGKKQALPRYYKEKLFTKGQRKKINKILAEKQETENIRKIKKYGTRAPEVALELINIKTQQFKKKRKEKL